MREYHTMIFIRNTHTFVSPSHNLVLLLLVVVLADGTGSGWLGPATWPAGWSASAAPQNFRTPFCRDGKPVLSGPMNCVTQFASCYVWSRWSSPRTIVQSRNKLITLGVSLSCGRIANSAILQFGNRVIEVKRRLLLSYNNSRPTRDHDSVSLLLRCCRNCLVQP